jgi:DNA-binding beta-propeller fold protein YncE
MMAMVEAAHADAGPNPTQSSAIAVVADGQAVWVVNPDANTIAKIGASSLTKLAEFPVGKNPRTLALSTSQYVYVACQDDDTVVRLDQTDGSMLTQHLRFGCAPYGVALNPEGTRLYVSCERTDTLLVLDPSLNTLATVTLGWPTPRGVAVSADGSRVYLTHFITKEPNNTGHVSEIDATNNTVSRVFDIPLDTTTCETINSAPGVYNLMQAIALTPPDSPPDITNQVWVAGTKENVANKGLFKRSSYFRDRPEARRFPFPFIAYPGDDNPSRRRNIFKPSFHEIIRSFIAKIDLATGTVKEFIDIKGGNAPTAIVFTPDGSVAVSVDRTSNRFALFNSARSGIVNDDPPAHGPGTCTANAFDTIPEDPVIAALPPEVELRVDDPTQLEAGGTPLTGLDYDVELNAMKPMYDGIGTGPIGAALSPDGQRVYTANWLARTVTVVDAAPGSYRCANALDRPCTTPLDCRGAGPGVCGDSIHGGPIQTCMQDGDCNPGIRCTHPTKCLPQIISVIGSTDEEPLPPELHDGKILFNISARDSSIPNGIGLAQPVPYTNYQSPSQPTKPGEVVSTSHDAEYLACSSCHVETGNDGRTWDTSQFGASLRNTGDLRGRASFAPGTCGDTAAEATRMGKPCTNDADCGTGSPLTTCQANPDFIPLANPAVAAERQRFFNPMGTIHWNADRDEVEDFEHAFRSLQGAGDCDGNEHLPDKCIGALVMRSNTTDPVDAFDDLGAPNRAIPGTSGIAGIRLTHMADFVYSATDYVRNPNIGAHGDAISMAAKRGRAIFNDPRVRCAVCHNGPSPNNQQFSDKRPLRLGEPGFDPMQPASGTNNPYLRHDVGTANIFDLTDPFQIATTTAPGGVFPNHALPMPASRGALTAYLTPTLVDAWNTAPYLHDGSAATLRDVIRPCSSHFEDCNAPTTGRNVDNRHGSTSFLTQDQLADLEAFLEAPHGPVGNGPIQAQLTISTLALSAPEFGFTFPIPLAGSKIGMTLYPLSGRVVLNGADFPVGMFDTGLAGVVIADVDDQAFPGTIDAAGNVSIPNFGLNLTVAGVPLHYVFNLQTGQVTLDGFKMTGNPLDPQTGAFSVVDIETGPPVPILGQPTDTTVRLSGTLDTIPMVLARDGAIAGVVMNRSGQPVAGATVALRGGTVHNVATDADGAFAFQHLRLGSYVLRSGKLGVGRDRTRVLLNADTTSTQVTVTLR